MHQNCICNKSSLDRQQKSYLKELGLSKEAIRVYDLLLSVGTNMSAQDAAAHTFDHPSAEYRLFYELEQRNLVRRLPGRPRTFAAMGIENGLQSAYLSQQKQLRSLLGQTTSQIDELAIILIGRQKVYESYMHYAQQATQQVCIYSIGIAYSKKLQNIQAEIVGRGVPLRHVLQELKPDNYHVAAKWQQIGVSLRLLARSRGYHLTIVDDSCAIVSFSNPHDTEQRVSMLTNNPDIIAIFQAQFDQIWQKSTLIKL